MNSITGQVIKCIAGMYTVLTTDKTLITCTARGKFRKLKLTPMVGDFVEVDIKAEPALSKIMPRKNMLNRPFVANIDTAVITMAASEPEFNSGLLDRFLVLSEYANINPIICINKADLCDITEKTTPYRQAGYDVIFVSAKEDQGLGVLKEYMKKGLYVFAGPSGVGKSSIINKLIPDADMQTGELSIRLSRGKHTTRHAEILQIPLGGQVIDTPGFSSLETDSIPKNELAALFKEFLPYIPKCNFNNCMHIKEVNCAIKNEVGENIHPLRYESYKNMMLSSTKQSKNHKEHINKR